MTLHTIIRISVLWLGTTLAVHVQAGIVLNTTRIIYPASHKEASLLVQNTGTGDILAQSWLEREDATEPALDLPFAVTPALARMPGNAKQLIRVIYAGEGMPADRESVFWLNVQEIPQSARENQLQIAIRQRIKLFYRPLGLAGDPLKAAQGVQWQLRDGKLQVYNPTPYHVSMIRLGLRQQDVELLGAEGRMLAPMQRVQLPLTETARSGPVELRFISINDFGAQEPYHATLSGGQAIEARQIESRPE